MGNYGKLMEMVVELFEFRSDFLPKCVAKDSRFTLRDSGWRCSLGGSFGFHEHSQRLVWGLCARTSGEPFPKRAWMPASETGFVAVPCGTVTVAFIEVCPSTFCVAGTIVRRVSQFSV